MPETYNSVRERYLRIVSKGSSFGSSLVASERKPHQNPAPKRVEGTRQVGKQSTTTYAWESLGVGTPRTKEKGRHLPPPRFPPPLEGPVQRCSEMFTDVQRCPDVFLEFQRFSPSFNDVQRASKMFTEFQRCPRGHRGPNRPASIGIPPPTHTLGKAWPNADGQA